MKCPFAVWRPLGSQTEPRRTMNIVCAHTMVGSLAGTDSQFKRDGFGGVESHFGVGHDGTIYQWQDTDYEADANLNGKDVISIETADTGTGFPSWSGENVPAWTDAQVNAMVRLIDWICDTHNIPKKLIPDTKPGRRGIGYHRMGCPKYSGYKAAGWPYDAWLVSGGVKWSEVIGKVCPGNRRIKQLVDVIIPRLNGALKETGVSAEDVVTGLMTDPPRIESPSADRYYKEVAGDPDATIASLSHRHLQELIWHGSHSANVKASVALNKLAALEALLAKLVEQENADLTAEQVKQIIEDAVVKVDVTVRTETEEPEPPKA